MPKQIYLDYAASTPVDKKVLAAMLPYLKKEYGNPSSMHSFGQRARAAIEKSRAQIAEFLHCQATEVVFTSGATEANNFAIRGRVLSATGKPHIVTTAIEHESILEPCRDLEQAGKAEVTYVKPQKDGIVRPEDVVAAVKKNTVLVSVQYANSEIGTVQPVAKIGKLLREHDVLFHTDAVQAANFLECDVQRLQVDLLTLSGHKVYGPKGVGVLYRKNGVSLWSLITGGGQEMDMRSGTENVAAIVGMGQAIEELQNPRLHLTAIKIRQMRDKLIQQIAKKISGSDITGSLEQRLPNNVHMRFMNIEGRDAVMLLDQKGIAVSTGSACSEKSQDPSHVLLALGYSREEALSAVRFTLGKHTTKEDLEKVPTILHRIVDQLRGAAV